MGLSPLSIAIVERSESATRGNLPYSLIGGSNASECSNLSIAPLVLAVGWPTGLRYLIEQGHGTVWDVHLAYQTAIEVMDETSALILIRTRRSLFLDDSWVFLDLASNLLNALRYKSITSAPVTFLRNIFRHVVNEYRTRLLQLIFLARTHLSKDQAERVGLSASQPLGVRSKELWETLTIHSRLEVPEGLEFKSDSPYLTGYSPCYTGSHYVGQVSYYRRQPYDAELLDPSTMLDSQVSIRPRKMAQLRC
jgi:hypothetical protein